MPRVIYLNESRIVTRVANFIFIDTESGKTLMDFFEHLKNYKQHTPHSLLHLIVLLLYDDRSALIPRFKAKWAITELQSEPKWEAIGMKMNHFLVQIKLIFTRK